MQNWRRILLPFSYLYAIVIYIRNLLFDNGKLRSFSFPLPVIGIGNITTGGSGKTPHVEYLIRLLQDEYRIATLSRGYGRKSKGFLLAEFPSDTHRIGDEPLLYLTKYRKTIVAVSEDRALAIQRLLKLEHPPQVVLMDDSYQHRRVVPGLNILLVEYDTIFRTDYLLPAGNLREHWSSVKRADIIIITKSPAILVPIERKRILEQLKTGPNQQVFFSFIRYGEFNRVFGPPDSMLVSADYYLEKRFTILLVSGIANPSGLIEYLRRHTNKLEMLIFPDHHEFSRKDIEKIQQTFDNITSQNKIIVTTEKDAMRLKNPNIPDSIQKLPLFFLPIKVSFHSGEEKFNQLINDYVRTNQANNRLLTRKD
jgi:tetraacyldisaccharide 4'-kinase